METDKRNFELRNLSLMIRATSARYTNEFIWQDVILTDEFQRCYTTFLQRSRYEVEFFTSTAVITTPYSKYIFVPNQWFVIASYAVEIYEELYKYKDLFIAIASHRGIKPDEYAKQLRDATTTEERNMFSVSASYVLKKRLVSENVLHDTILKLWRFATDYSWWSGQKTIDRSDFHMSVILNSLNLLIASQGYVADIVSAYANDTELRHIVRSTDGFTVNLQLPEGYSTYTIPNDTNETDYSSNALSKINTSSINTASKPVIKIDIDKVKVIKVKN